MTPTNLGLRHAQYSRQRIVMVKETPILYQKVVQPYIEGFPPSRFEWQVALTRYDCRRWILKQLEKGPQHSVPSSRISENPIRGQWSRDRLCHSTGHEMGSGDNFFSVSRRHYPLAFDCYPTRSYKNAYSHVESNSSRIRKTGERKMGSGWRAVPTILYPLPAFILYIIGCLHSVATHWLPFVDQDHFHVHIVNANYIGFKGICVGQAHILEDVISLVCLKEDGQNTLLTHNPAS